MMAKNSVQVTILGQRYTIGGDDTKEEIIRISEAVDRDIRDTMKKNPRASATMAAVLVAMTYRDERQKSDASAEHMRQLTKAYADESAKLKSELSEAKRKLGEQNAEIVMLKDKLSRAKKK